MKWQTIPLIALILAALVGTIVLLASCDEHKPPKLERQCSDTASVVYERRVDDAERRLRFCERREAGLRVRLRRCEGER